MSRLSELIDELCPEGVEYKKLGDCLTYEQPSKYIVHSSEYENNGVPVLTAGQTFILGYTSETDGIYNASKEKPVIIFDDFTTSFHWVNFKFKVKSSAMKMLYPAFDNVSFRYIYYAMKCIKYETLEHSRQWISKYSNIEIPIPPLPVQEEIVRILDTFTALITELEEELEARKLQYEYYREKLLTFKDGVEYKRVGEVCPIITDYTAAGSFADIAKNVKYINNGKGYAQLVRTTDLKSRFSNPNNFVYVDEHAFKYLWRVNLDSEALVLPNVGVNCGEVYYVTPNMLPNTNNVLGPNAILLKSESINIKFLYYLFCSHELQTKISMIISPGGQTKYNKTNFKELQIPIPPLAEQQRIVSILDKFEELISDPTHGIPAEIEARRQQYEYYRDKLLTFKRKETVEA